MRRKASFQDRLARVPLFEGLAEDEVARIAHLAARLHEPAGEILVKEGERGDELMIVLDGTVDVLHGDELLASLGPDDFLGEIALVDDDARRSATAVAKTAVVVAHIGREDFEHLMSEFPVLAERVEQTRVRRRSGHSGTDAGS